MVGHATRQWVSEVIVFIAIGILIGPEVLGIVGTEQLAGLDPVSRSPWAPSSSGSANASSCRVLRQIRATLAPIAVLEVALVFSLCFVGLLAVGLPVS